MNTINLNKIIKSYFNLHFKNYKFNDSKYVSRKKRRFFLRRIYLSKLETKHTNAKTKITFYTMNIGKKFLHKKYISLSKYIRKNILSY
jgi:ribonuclease HII